MRTIKKYNFNPNIKKNQKNNKNMKLKYKNGKNVKNNNKTNNNNKNINQLTNQVIVKPFMVDLTKIKDINEFTRRLKHIVRLLELIQVKQGYNTKQNKFPKVKSCTGGNKKIKANHRRIHFAGTASHIRTTNAKTLNTGIISTNTNREATRSINTTLEVLTT